MLGLVGQKIGMTRVFTEEGKSVPVTVVQITPNRISRIKNLENDGYTAIQVTVGTKKAKKVTKPVKGFLKKASVEAGRGYWEFRVSSIEEYSLGQELTVDMFSKDQVVDATGRSKGKGFAGVVKRHNFSTQDATHGNSLSHRAPGSIGQNQTPGRVFKGKRMAGRMGAVQRTAQNLTIVDVDTQRQVLLIKGAVPGAPGSDVIIKPAVKVSSTEVA